MIKIVERDERKVTDYMSSDELHDIINRNIKKFDNGEFNAYQQMPGMIIRTDQIPSVFPGDERNVKSKYWKFVKGDEDGKWEVYEIDKDGVSLNNRFVLD